MDRNWIFASRLSPEYANGVEEFIRFAVDHAENKSRIPCPCLDCCQVERVNEEVLRDHLFVHGIDRSYTRWIWHGEEEDPVVHHDKRDCDTCEGDNYEGDRLEDMVDVIKGSNFQDNAEIFETLMDDAQMPLYKDCPNFTSGHWMLAAISPREDTVYWFDSLHGGVKAEFKEVIEMAMTMFFAELKENKCRKNTRWLIVKGPRQSNNIDCGYYILRYMREIIQQRTITIPIEYFTRSTSPYTVDQLDEIREEWVEFVEKHVIW